MHPAISLLIVLLANFGLPIALLITGILCHRRVKRKRHAYLAAEEARLLAKIRISSSRKFAPGATAPELLFGTAAVANNYFTAFVSSWKNIFGGELKSYSLLCDDARRLALVRLLLDAEGKGCNQIYNLRFATATIQQGNHKTAAGAELFAYGTGVTVPVDGHERP